MTLENRKLADLLAAQQSITSKIALGKPLAECLTAICQAIEAILAPAITHSSILLLNHTRMQHGASPTLPTAYTAALDGLEIGPDVGSCGTAMWRGERVIVGDIATDPLWENYKDIALRHNLRACWSTPITSKTDKILGSFAIYYEHPATPTDDELEIIDQFSFLSKLAIQHAAIHDELKQTNARLSALARVLPDLAIVVNEHGEFRDIFGADDSLLSAGTRELGGQKIVDLLPEPLAKDILATIQRAFETTEFQTLEYELQVEKGLRIFEGRVTPIDHYLLASPDTKHALWMARDITEQKRAELQIENLAFYDPLTLLPNRRLLIDRLKTQLEQAKRKRKTGAILYLDLDDFKRINDSLGHSEGDKLLHDVARRLEPLFRKADTLARIGGDEFVVVLQDLNASPSEAVDTANQVAEKIIAALEPEFKVQSYQYRIGVSIGISLIDADATSTDEILKRADAAMYRSKKTPGNSISLFNPSLQEKLDKRLAMERALIAAIDTDQFTAHFQPQIDCDGKLYAAEALVRWQTDTGEFIPPLKFLKIAERCGVIGKIQNLVLHESCRFLNRLKDKNLLAPHFQVSINISPSQFKLTDFVDSICTTLEQYRISPNRLVLEITENMLVDNVASTVKKMHRLRELGFSIAIDDFGIGFSSLSYLQRFPISQIKIDKSFIDHIDNKDADNAIVDAIIAMATHLKFDIIAEGIEREAQADMLRLRGIHAMQGYYFSRPVPTVDFIRFCQQT